MRLLAPFSLLLAGLAVGQESLATETDPDRLEAAYRKTAPWSGLKLARVDRPPFLLFLQEGTDSPLRQVAEQRSAVLLALVKVFEERIAKPLKLERRPRPLPVWFVADRELYEQTGGGIFQARFDDRAQHTVVLYDVSTKPWAAVHVMAREVVRQLVAAHLPAGRPARLDTMSAWLVEGLAEALAMRPDVTLARDKDPQLGQLQPGLVAELASRLGRFSWESKARLSWLHHPLAVVLEPDLARYLQATGVKDADDVRTQIEYHRQCSYAVVSFFMLAYQGHYRPKLEALLGRELRGEPPAAAFAAVLSAEERAALPALFEGFVRNPPAVVAAKMAPGADRATPPADSAAADEPAERPVRPAPPAVALAEALVAYRRLDLGGVEEMIGQRTDAPAKEIAAASETLDALIAAWGKTALEKRGKARVFLPGKGSATVSWKIEGWDDAAMQLSLAVDKTRRTVGLWEVPAHLFAESALELGVVTGDPQKRALGLLVALQLRALPDDAQRRAIETRFTRKGLAVQAAPCDAAGPTLLAALAVQDARDALASRPPEDVLPGLVERLNALPRSDDLRFVVDERVRALLDDAFARSRSVLPPLRGKATQLAGGRVRIDYDWSDPRQLEDWVAVDAVQESVPIENPGAYDKSKVKAVVDARKGQLLLHGQACLRHKLSFRGDLDLASVFGWRVIEVDGEEIFDVRGPPAWGLFVRKGNTLAACGWASIATYVRGTTRKIVSLDDDDRDTAAEAARNGKPLVFRRRGDTLTLGPAEGEPLLSVDVKSLRAEGGVWMIQPQSPPEEKADEPLGMVGATSIEGAIDPADLVEQRKAFVSQWLGRLR